MLYEAAAAVIFMTSASLYVFRGRREDWRGPLPQASAIWLREI